MCRSGGVRASYWTAPPPPSRLPEGVETSSFVGDPVEGLRRPRDEGLQVVPAGEAEPERDFRPGVFASAALAHTDADIQTLKSYIYI